MKATRDSDASRRAGDDDGLDLSARQLRNHEGVGRMAKVAGQHGGLYASHIRGEGKELTDSIKEAIEIGERGGLPVEVFHLKAAYQPWQAHA